MSGELKGCPFCGSEAECIEPSFQAWIVMCVRCGASCDEHRTEAEALAAWNRRAGGEEQDAVRWEVAYSDGEWESCSRERYEELSSTSYPRRALVPLNGGGE